MAGGIQREVIVIKALSLDLHDRNIVRKISQIIEPQNAIEGTGGRREYDLDRVRNLERQIAQVDAEIDQRVYALYGLSEDEIRIVEGK